MMAKFVGNKIEALTLKQVDKKIQILTQLRRNGGRPKYDDKKVEELINKRLETRIKEGSLGGINLTHKKAELQSDIGHLERKLLSVTDVKTRDECNFVITDLNRKLSKIQEELKKQAEMELYVQYEQMEKSIAAEEWLKQ